MTIIAAPAVAVPAAVREEEFRADALAAPGFGAIAEFKRRSPSAGDLRPGGDVAAVARTYEAAGARAMSVLVDERFAGAWDDLRAARDACSLPLKMGVRHVPVTALIQGYISFRACGREFISRDMPPRYCHISQRAE